MANLLGATVLAVNDLVLTGVTAAAGVSTSGAAALVSLVAAPGLSVTELGRRVGLSQPAAARMVDSLQEHGLVERRRSVGRWVAVYATERGRRAAEHILAARADPLRELVDTLDDEARETLGGLLERLLERIYVEIGDNQRVCRLCDRAACLAHDSVCPVGQAARERGEVDRAGQPIR
ncbi:MarR family transcriptional regulator [Amycolatopsis arida]|uniref:MarR family transcriptional regulator n=1 Tax=Amycolatopsis arida TaxID=587909 RepID=UPI001FBB62FF|nr:MarR family transcriptional regulator [Amycolatopsis arida]